jgi:hypothetical protein
MGQFLEAEKSRQAAFKLSSPHFTEAAQVEGVYKGRPRPFCLPQECAEENLFCDIRAPAPAYFARHEIKWHDGQDAKPSNHLCDSQVCCVNFLFPFADKPEALVELLRSLFPAIRQTLPMDPGQLVSFEWIGERNYLREKCRTSKRTRGANFTSADAAVMFEHQDGRRQIVLIEWKYTESYGGTWLRFARRSGTDRRQIYAWLYDCEDCFLDKALLPCFCDLFYEPFYQFMRQQFLAHEMEKAHELGADIVSLLHIAPAHNLDFRRVTSPALRCLGDSAIDVWKRLVKAPDRFASVTTEGLFGRLPVDRLPELATWWAYTNQRYPWLDEVPD